MRVDLKMLKSLIIANEYLESSCIYFIPSQNLFYGGYRVVTYINKLKKYQLIQELIHD